MNILYLTVANIKPGGLGESANAVQARRMIAALNKYSDSIVTAVATYSGKKQLAEQQLESISSFCVLSKKIEVRYFGVFLFALLSSFKLLLRRGRFDVLYSRNTLLLFTVSLFFPSASKFVELHMPPTRMEYILISLLCRIGLNCVFCVSDTLAENLRKNIQRSSVDVRVLRNSADESFMSISQPSQPLDNTVLYFGSLTARKGFGLIASVASLMPENRFVCYGDSSAVAGDLPHNIELMGPVSADKVPELIGKSNGVLIAPYVLDVQGEMLDTVWGSPIKIFEYMASGRPFVASDIPIIREIVGDSYPFLVGENIPSAWVEKIQQIQREDFKSFERWHTRLKFKENYSLKVRTKELLGVIRGS